MCSLQQSSHTAKPPRPVLNSIFAFPPNRETFGGTAYLIVRNEGNILIDSPFWNQTNQDFILNNGGIRWLFITHRNAIGQTSQIQQTCNCEILIQEQEAYLLPELRVTTFGRELSIDSDTQAIWTPGHTPGSSCFYYGDRHHVLFSGRHLVPNRQGYPVPLRIAKTFHWQRQLRSLKSLLSRFTDQTLEYICPGANTGFLRGERVINNAYNQLATLDIEALKNSVALL